MSYAEFHLISNYHAELLQGRLIVNQSGLGVRNKVRLRCLALVNSRDLGVRQMITSSASGGLSSSRELYLQEATCPVCPGFRVAPSSSSSVFR